MLIKVQLPPKPTRPTIGIICDYKHVIYTLPESVVKKRILNKLDKETLIPFYSQTTIPPPNSDQTRGNWNMISLFIIINSAKNAIINHEQNIIAP